MKSGAGLPVCAGWAPRLQAETKRQREQDNESSEIEETAHTYNTERQGRNERVRNRCGKTAIAKTVLNSKAAGWKPVLGLSDDPGGGEAPRDWREWAGKTLAGTVFAQPEPRN